MALADSSSVSTVMYVACVQPAALISRPSSANCLLSRATNSSAVSARAITGGSSAQAGGHGARDAGTANNALRSCRFPRIRRAIMSSAPCAQRTSIPDSNQSTTANTNSVPARPPKMVSSPRLSAKEPMMPASQFATKLIRNQTPIISDARRSGASLVTIERPTGEMQSSPIVWNRYASTSHHMLALPWAAWSYTAPTIHRKPMPREHQAGHHLRGVGGLRPCAASLPHNAVNSGASSTMKSGLTDWNQPAGTSKPPTRGWSSRPRTGSSARRPARTRPRTAR